MNRLSISYARAHPLRRLLHLTTLRLSTALYFVKRSRNYSRPFAPAGRKRAAPWERVRVNAGREPLSLFRARSKHTSAVVCTASSSRLRCPASCVCASRPRSCSPSLYGTDKFTRQRISRLEISQLSRCFPSETMTCLKEWLPGGSALAKEKKMRFSFHSFFFSHALFYSSSGCVR